MTSDLSVLETAQKMSIKSETIVKEELDLHEELMNWDNEVLQDMSIKQELKEVVFKDEPLFQPKEDFSNEGGNDPRPLNEFQDMNIKHELKDEISFKEEPLFPLEEEYNSKGERDSPLVNETSFKMDNDKLISLVHEHPSLWNMSDKNYHNRDISWQKWEKVAAELNTSSAAAKSKWRGLRDTFCKELANNSKKRSGDEGRIFKESKWIYFKSMEFLKDQFKKRQLHGNVPSEIVDEDAHNDSSVSLAPEDLELEHDSPTQVEEAPQEMTIDTPQKFAVPKKKIAKSKNAAAVDKLIKLEEQKLEILKAKNSATVIEDCDYHFLMSLLPYLRKIPEERKMFVRTKLQQVFCDEEFLGSRGHHVTLDMNKNPTCYATDNLSWSSGSEVQTPHSTPTPHHIDLALYFSQTMTDTM